MIIIDHNLYGKRKEFKDLAEAIAVLRNLDVGLEDTDLTLIGQVVFNEDGLVVGCKERFPTIHDVLQAGVTLDPMQCLHCGEVGEVTYNQGVGDALCELCGKWQLEEGA